MPPSQVVRPIPRGQKAYDKENDPGSALLPDIEDDPKEGDRITYSDRTLFIPK